MVLSGCDAAGNTALPSAATGIKLDQASLRLDEGATSRLRVLLIESDGRTRELNSSDVTWVVTNPEIASVTAGLVTALRPGSTRVTATVSGKQAVHADITVLAVPGSIEFLYGARQFGVVGQALGAPIGLRVLNRQGQPMGGLQLELLPVESSGTVSPSVVTLTAEGTAEVRWTLGTRSGPQVVEIRVAGREAMTGAITAEAAPGPVATVQVQPSDALTNPGGRVRYSAAALDQYGNVVTDAQLEWQVADPSIATVTAEGTARALTAGETDIQAVYVGDASAAARGQGPENRGQGKLRSRKDGDFPVQVADLRSPSQGTSSVTLAFTQVGDGNGGPANYEVRYAPTPMNSFASGTVVRQGTCASPIQGTAIGSTLACVVEGLEGGRSYDFQVISFRGTLGVNAVFGPESNLVTARTSSTSTPALVEIIGGNNQTGAPGSRLASPISVRVKNAYGQTMPGVTVNWAVLTGGGSVSSTATTTNALGVAEVFWTLGPAAGTNNARAIVGALTADFTATGQASAVTSVTVSPGSATVSPGGSMQLTAEAKDAQGRVVPSVFNWYSTDAGKATVSSSGMVTGIAAGSASIRAAVASVEGSAQVTVQANGENAVPVWIEVLSGHGQTGKANAELPLPLQVKVWGSNNKGLVGTTVTWTVVRGGGAPSSTQTTTDAQGVTSVRWTLGSVLGSQEIRATAGSETAPFTATAEEGSAAPRPPRVTTLTVDSTGSDRMHMRFSQVDDGTGNPAGYVVRYHISPISWNWASAAEAVVGTCANLQGTATSGTLRCWVGGLQAGRTYDVQVLPYRIGSNGERIYAESPSNVATGTTLAGGQGRLTVSPSSATLNALGATQQFSVTARDANNNPISNPGVSWTSGNPAIATIDSNGMLTARGVGTVVITAAAACCASEQITVVVQQSVASVSVTPANASLSQGESTRLIATARDANGNPVSNATFAWQSSNSGVASVATDGTVRGENGGSATVTASAAGRSAAAAISVSNSAPPPPDQNWPNEPGGHTPIVNITSFSSASLPDQVAGRWDYSAGYFNYVSAVNGALRWRFPAGFEGGSSTGRAVITDTMTTWRDYYIGVTVRFSPGWTRHPSADKVLYWGELSARNPTAGQAYIGRVANGVGGTVQANQGGEEVCPIKYSTARNFPCSFDASGEPFENWLNQTRIDDGAWHRIEVIARGSTNQQANGYFVVYVDGIKQWEYSNVKFSRDSVTKFHGINLDPVWGGGPGVFKPKDEWMEIGALRVTAR